uniref:NADH:ubiquinone reductase (H(+)-translocating) n=1 Tax=Mesocestoides corti TaxID=53468 RepID=A0A1E1GI36_MESCO|nr:NADH dehydrogenase subunit 5 [Mesocestoides corti]
MFILFLLLFGFSVIVFVGFLIGYVFNCFGNVNFLFLSGIFNEFFFNFDNVTLGIVLMLFICFVYVYNYTGHYFSGDFCGVDLNKLIVIFVGVMASLVFTGDFLSTLIFWEYLGVVSYFLIFFYGSYLSLRSSVITLVSSRFGDVCLFFLIGLSINVFGDMGLLCFFIMFFVIFTKSAGFPFISWLLEAMRAPTPVSSLVHSSTLVAAGVWFAMRYDVGFFCRDLNLFVFGGFLLLTIFITGLSCFFFVDLKKMVALSTCNNISWCVFYLLVGDVCLSLFQLLSHGVSKCMLFMLVGDVMSGSVGSQASNCVYSSRLYNNYGIFSLFCVILGLSGAPFIGVYFTKHYMLCTFTNIYSFVYVSLVYVCVFLSYLYSFRLCSVLVNINSSNSIGVRFLFNSWFMVYYWLFINFFVFLFFDEVCLLNGYYSLIIIMFQVVNIFLAYFFYCSSFFVNWSSSLFGSDNLVEQMYNIYYYVTNYIDLFFYRWDNNVLLLFVNLWSLNNSLVRNVLNLTLFSFLFINNGSSMM